MKQKIWFFVIIASALFSCGCPSVRFVSTVKQGNLPNDEIELRKSIVHEALSHKGTRYVYGGCSPKGFECSGFVQYVYGKLGIKLPRTVKDMESECCWVKQKDLIAGDLVIFHNPRHVGIYASKGTFVHASSSRGIVRDQLDREYYRKRFVGGKNIISNRFLF